MEIIAPLLYPIVKALFLDLLAYIKTRESVFKVKIFLDLTKDRSLHVWIGYIEHENGEGMWQNIPYEGVPDYCYY